jgi:hypothetical protein
VPVLRHALRGKLRKGNIQIFGIRQVKEFTLRHNTIREGVNDGAFGSLVRASDFDGMVSQSLDDSSDAFGPPREAKNLHLASFG